MSHWYDRAYERVNRLSQIVTFVDPQRGLRSAARRRENPQFRPEIGIFASVRPEPSDRRARIENVVGIQCGLDAPVEFHRLRPDLAFEPRPLQAANAVFAGDRAAEPDGQVHDL